MPTPTIFERYQKSPAAAEPRKRYRAGLLPDAPVDVYAAGGVAFTKFTDQVKRAPDGTTMRIPRPGTITQPLTAEEHRRVLDGVARHGIRRAGNRTEKAVFDDPRYVPDPTDEPIAAFAYLEEVSEEELARDERRPATLLEQARRDAEAETAQAAETEARLDPQDQRHRAQAARAKRTGETPPMLQ